MSKPLRLDPLFNDHMVIQRNKAFVVWGTGPDGERVTVSCRGESASDEVQQGQWRVTLPAMGVGESCELIVQAADSTITLVDVVFGDVWLAGGQSNMEWSLNKSKDANSAIESANLALLRYYEVPRVAFEVEGIKFKSKWKTCTPDNAGDFSAVAYYFARDLIASEQVPIGIIGCNWGGTSASCWVEEEVLQADPELSIYPKEFSEQMQGFDWQEFKLVNKAYNDAVNQHNRNFEAGHTGDELGLYPWPPPMSPQSFMRPSGLYETMLRKVFSFVIKGVIYYQGESDAHRPEMYSHLMEVLILDWRRQWKDEELPFLFVQLPIYACNNNPTGEEWPLIREAQQQAADRLSNTGMAVLLDCGEPADIHPIDKKPVGERLALLALDKVYGRAIKSSGPVYKELIMEDEQVVVHFDYVEAGLLIRGGGRLAGFEIAAEDGEFHLADAEIDGKTVRVSSEQVTLPRFVRYGWANVTDANLIGVDRLPAAPFRTIN
ncbi:sialate O-acetylesterase [Paenibacillus psychroresistens]|uniref:Sialate O-acetylesterase n=1 Tax=Paenibacillus psychroresistens TaxID=1778678 RepID=A0A6B8RUQ6_9BACL|nr:sialate O-acetylesterase [Paenibacillus psychroresistens]QGQ99026.1 sialate O-acetylesterase [Paenibacillus psychroresistens]